MGGAIELGLTYNSGDSNTVSNSVYAAFLVITSLGSFIPFLLVSTTAAGLCRRREPR